MATINFPSSPTNGQTYSFGGKTWTYNGTGWALATTGNPLSPTVVIPIAVSDEVTALTTGTAKTTFRMPFGFILSSVRASVTTAPTGSVLTVDINKNGTSILSTKITIDATEKTSLTAAALPVLSNTAFVDDDEVTIDIDTIGATIAGVGLKVYLIGKASVSNQREVLTADRTYYVSTTGSDTNSGLSVGSPFLTIQKAVDIVASLDRSIYQVTIQLADGTYTTATSITLKLGVGSLRPIILGNSTTPSNVHLNLTGAINVSGSGNDWALHYFKLSSTTLGLFVNNAADVVFLGLNFGVCTTSHMYAVNGGRIASSNISSYTISGATSSHVIALFGAIVTLNSVTVTLTTSITVGTFILCERLASVRAESWSIVLGGFTVTGNRYAVGALGLIFGTAASSTYFPGSVNGTIATGGQYL